MVAQPQGKNLGVGELACQVLQRLTQRREIQVTVCLRFGYVSGSLQGQRLADVPCVERDQ
ncbi:MAG: hypothetical protein ACRDR6_10395 [Pseudonocardiaceae bacterium]